MKRISALMLSLFCVLFIGTHAGAVDNSANKVDLGDGYYMIVTTTQNVNMRASTTTANTQADIYNGSTKVGTAYLTAKFSYDGSRATALSGTASGTGQNGWVYNSGSVSCSGAKATGSYKFSSSTTSKAFSLAITCSPSGAVS